MHISRKITIAIALLLITSFVLSLALVPSANAHTPSWTIISYAYLSVQPNPVGTGQTVDVCMWVDTAMPGATIDNNIRRHDYTLTITAPNGEIETQTWDIVNDPTGVQFYRYTPTQVGNYTFEFSYPQQTYTWSGQYQDDVFTASSRTKYLTVQEEPAPTPITSYPLPTEYWTRPIEGQNNYWYTVASNWLGRPYIPGAGAAYIGGEQPDGSAPNSAHIMWTKPIQYGGVVGGNNTAVPGEGFYTGLSYNTRFTNPLIMQGTLFYQEPYGNSGTGGDYVAVDLRTGQELWRISLAGSAPSFGYLYSLESPNQHGVLPDGLLIASQGGGYGGGPVTWQGYDPRTGQLTSMNVTGVPSGASIAGPSGEYLTYVLANLGTRTNPQYNLMQWNSSRAFGGMGGLGTVNWYSGTVDASSPSCYDWNVSLNLPAGGWSIGTAGRGLIPLVTLDNVLLLIQGSFGGHVGDMGAIITTDPGNITAISLKPETLGQVLWTETYPPAPGNNTRYLSAWDPANGVFIFTDKESFANWGYSIANGKYLWGPSYPPETDTVDWNYMIWYTPFCQYGNLYMDGFSGLLYCWNDTTGDLQWTYGNGGPGNSTKSGFETPYGVYPEFVVAVAEGKIYIVGNEHSPNSPMYKGSELRCINATNGAELWTIFGWGNLMSGASGAVADGYLTVFNSYDSQIYCYGKGPSAMTVDTPKAAITEGSSLVITGTVTDVSAGTQQNEQAARFPNGVPTVSDASMGDWMEYVYMQKPKPTNVTGVTVNIHVIDSNNNYRNIGTTTSDSNGFFSYQWTPDIPGKYTVIASFAGSESYWPSQAVSAFAVDASPKATPGPTPTSTPMSELYFLPSVVGIIVAIAVVGALMLLMLRKR